MTAVQRLECSRIAREMCDDAALALAIVEVRYLNGNATLGEVEAADRVARAAEWVWLYGDLEVA